ncbi:MAG: DUF6457 domain-containing protein [Acidimicrobiales bacterium]
MTGTRAEWLRRFADELGVPEPTDAEIESLLAVAGAAAHASERTAAPLSCWLVGKAGLDPSLARAVADRIARDLG